MHQASASVESFQLHCEQGAKALTIHQFSEALKCYDRACKDAEAFGPADDRLTDTLLKMAEICRFQRNYERAEFYYKRALAFREKMHGRKSLIFCNERDNLGNFYVSSNKNSEAIALFKQALEEQTTSVGTNGISLTPYLTRLANSYQALGDYKNAEQMTRQKLSIIEHQPQVNNSTKGIVEEELAELVAKQGRYADAIQLCLTAIKTQQANGAESFILLPALEKLGKYYFAANKFTEAESTLKRILSIQEKESGEGSPVLVQSLTELAAILRKTGKEVEAERCLQRARTIEKRHTILKPR
jgi:tetratricopeptide (TPR) repeat protein